MDQVKMTTLVRKVVLLKGFSKTDRELLQTNIFIDKYKEWFESNAGGAYDAGEIDILEDISSEYLKSNYKDKMFDFIVIVLLGHGATQEDYQLFKLNEIEIIKPGQIDGNSKKQLIIIESCRNIASEIPTIDLSDKMPSYKTGGKLCLPICRKNARALYDEQIKNCDNGKVVCFACSKNEKAMNFIFTRKILEYSHQWHLSPKHKDTTLNITNLMSCIRPMVNELAVQECKEKQNPEISGNINFPFAVSKF